MSNYLFKKIDFLVKSPLDGEGVCVCVCVGVCGCAVCGCVVCVVWVAHISIVKTKKLRFFRIFFWASIPPNNTLSPKNSLLDEQFGDGLKNLSFLCDTSMET